MTTTPSTTTHQPAGHRWRTAGDAWGHAAVDWSCLFEHYAVGVIQVALDRLGVGPGSRLLDIACGSGLAARMAEVAGAEVAGIDASERLISVARARCPDADLRTGTMFELPWDDQGFDAVTSINGIWGGCEAALAEAHRVLRPGGRILVSFWGRGHLDLRPCFKVFAAHSPDAHREGMRRTNDIARAGVAESMLEASGFEVLERGSRMSTVEWPDADTAWRAVSSVGPAVPALQHAGADVLRPLVMEVLERTRDEHGIFRFRNDQEYVVAQRPR
ncbi:class I SAM-dependent methyltransferase [Nocardioides aestuarii]|uniref:Class I SAM-dependent methyltransferase n=1 Tax=Nocardioides aestuarii TaxID=252231 RepID=A0ABW4TRD3_9ACTN